MFTIYIIITLMSCGTNFSYTYMKNFTGKLPQDQHSRIELPSPYDTVAVAYTSCSKSFLHANRVTSGIELKCRFLHTHW